MSSAVSKFLQIQKEQPSCTNKILYNDQHSLHYHDQRTFPDAHNEEFRRAKPVAWAYSMAVLGNFLVSLSPSTKAAVPNSTPVITKHQRINSNFLTMSSSLSPSNFQLTFSESFETMGEGNHAKLIRSKVGRSHVPFPVLHQSQPHTHLVPDCSTSSYGSAR